MPSATTKASISRQPPPKLLPCLSPASLWLQLQFLQHLAWHLTQDSCNGFAGEFTKIYSSCVAPIALQGMRFALVFLDSHVKLDPLVPLVSSVPPVCLLFLSSLAPLGIA